MLDWIAVPDFLVAYRWVSRLLQSTQV